MQNLQQKRQTTLFELKVVRYNKKDGEAAPIDDEDSDGDDPEAELSGTESLDDQSTSSELLSKDASTTLNTIPADIAQSKYHSPIQPVFENYPRTTIGTGKNSRNRSFSHHWYSKFPFIEYSVSNDAVFCYACRLFPHPTAFTEPVFTSVGYRGWKSIKVVEPIKAAWHSGLALTKVRIMGLLQTCLFLNGEL